MTKRTIIRGDDIPEHPQPFPTAVRVGNLLFSSAIGGKDMASGKFPEDKKVQIALAFKHVEAIVKRAGGSTDDIGKVTVYLADKSDRELVNEAWLAMFPNAEDRPVRHTVQLDMAPGCIIQLEFMAVV